MKIRVLGIRGLPSTYSGLETIMSELAPRWVEQGHEVTVYCRKALYDERPKEWKGVKLEYNSSIEHKALSTLTHSLLAVLHASFHQSDVVLVWNAANGPFGWILRLFGKRAVINVDGMEWLRPKWKGFGRIYFKWAARMATRAYPVVITDADEMKRLYLKEFGIETEYIAYGANIEPSEHPEVVEQYGLKPREYYLIASRLVPDNSSDLIVEAFVKSDSNKVLAIAGGADYRGNTIEKQFIDELKRVGGDRVVFLGHIDNFDHIKELHHHCYGYVHGHKFGGINPSLLKALGFSNCILALNTPFNSEVLDGGRYGLLFEENVEDLTDKFNLLEEQPELAEEFRLKAPDRIRERFNWDAVSDEYLELFEGLSRK